MVDSTTVLLLIDFQEWIVRDVVGAYGWDAANAATAAARQARDRGDLVVHVRYLHADGSDGGPDSAQTRFVDTIEVLPGEPIITKYGRSAFEETELDAVLERQPVGRVLLTGVVTEGGIEATAYSALRRGYKVDVLSDAVAGSTQPGNTEALQRLKDAGVGILTTKQRGQDSA